MSIRLRFTLWATAIMLGLLAALSVGIHYTMARNLQSEMDQRLERVYISLITNPDLFFDAESQSWVNALENPEPFAAPGLYIQVLDTGFEVRGQTDNLANETIAVSREIIAQNQRGERTYYVTEIDGRDLRVYSRPLILRNGQILGYVQVAESMEQINSALGDLRTILAVGTVLATVGVAIAAWFIASAAIRPLSRMTATAQAIGDTSDLSQRIDPPNSNDEVEQLAHTFNRMLDRLEAAFNAQRQFVADASHELRTPLTALRGNTDILRAMVESDRISPEILAEGLSDIGNEADRLTRLVQDLLTLARADVGWRPELERVDLTEIAADAARIAGPLGRNHNFEVTVPEETLEIKGSGDQLVQLILILLDNAFKHTPDGSKVRLSVEQDANNAIIRVKDDGPGFAREYATRIFDRFFRPDVARTRSAGGGTGLGLAIARWIALIHNGTITAESAPGQGATFTVTIPLIEPDQPKSRSRLSRQPSERSASIPAS